MNVLSKIFPTVAGFSERANARFGKSQTAQRIAWLILAGLATVVTIQLVEIGDMALAAMRFNEGFNEEIKAENLKLEAERDAEASRNAKYGSVARPTAIGLSAVNEAAKVYYLHAYPTLKPGESRWIDIARIPVDSRFCDPKTKFCDLILDRYDGITPYRTKWQVCISRSDYDESGKVLVIEDGAPDEQVFETIGISARNESEFKEFAKSVVSEADRIFEEKKLRPLIAVYGMVAPGGQTVVAPGRNVLLDESDARGCLADPSKRADRARIGVISWLPGFDENGAVIQRQPRKI
jgi:hypothetical protein